MPQKNHLILFAAVAVAIGALSYAWGLRGGTLVDKAKLQDSLPQATAPVPFPEAKGAEDTPKAEAASAQVQAQVLVANGVGDFTAVDSVDNGAEEKRAAFLAASENRGVAEEYEEEGKRGRGARRFDAVEETSEFSDGEISEMSQRLEALEQAFAVDSKRNKSRAGGANQEEVAEIRDQVSNLYDIVGALPSIDTLETKIAAVDGAIEEMNATMEKLVELGERLQKIEGGEAATERVEGRIAKMEEALANSKSEFDKKVDEMKKVSSDGLKAAEAQAESLAVKISGLSQQMEKQEDAAKKVSTQIGVLDRNLRSAVEGYTKVYEGAGRTEKRFLEIEAFLGNAESRLSAIEANFGPGQQ